MSNWEDEDFMKSLEEEYPSTDWNNLPKPYPVWEIHGKVYDKDYRGKDYESPFGISNEYLTREWAEYAAARISRKWTKLVPGSIEIREVKSRHEMGLALFAEFRQRIMAGEKVFPMYLP